MAKGLGDIHADWLIPLLFAQTFNKGGMADPPLSERFHESAALRFSSAREWPLSTVLRVIQSSTMTGPGEHVVQVWSLRCRLNTKVKSAFSYLEHHTFPLALGRYELSYFEFYICLFWKPMFKCSLRSFNVKTHMYSLGRGPPWDRRGQDGHSVLVRVVPAVLPGVGYISWVGSFGDVPAHFAVSVWRQQHSGSHHQTQAVVERVPLLWTVLREEAVAQRVIAHHVLHLETQDRHTSAMPWSSIWRNHFQNWLKLFRA